ncbi:hypothetical protein BDZ97DRAFT_1759726 [Flammula alnicola]|nr:hypothetical protein BDZ97DRAFT_1759726 [Flammula alnicola]
MLESLHPYANYPQIEAAAVRLAKLTWGCPAYRNTPVISLIYELEGLKENNCSGARAGWKKEAGDGSYNLSSTIIKGDGKGTILPAIQISTPQASSQILAILQTLHELRWLIMPKCIQCFKMEITDFHSEWNNVGSFGGLEPNAISVQMNISSLGSTLRKAIGEIQGQWHVDQSDNYTNWMLLTLLLCIGPDEDPSPFCLAHAGLYVRELNCWILWIMFNGTDIHSGYSPSEDPEAHDDWICTVLEPAWNMSGKKAQAAFFAYTGDLVSNRAGSMNMTLFLGFRTYRMQTQTQAKHKNFAMHGQVALAQDEDSIWQCLSWYAWHEREWSEMYLGITKALLKQHQQTSILEKTLDTPLQLTLGMVWLNAPELPLTEADSSLEITKVFGLVSGPQNDMLSYQVELQTGAHQSPSGNKLAGVDGSLSPVILLGQPQVVPTCINDSGPVLSPVQSWTPGPLSNIEEQAKEDKEYKVKEITGHRFLLQINNNLDYAPSVDLDAQTEPAKTKQWLSEPVQLLSYIQHVDELLDSKSLLLEIKGLQLIYRANARSLNKSYYAIASSPSDIIELWFNQTQSTQLLSSMLPDNICDSHQAAGWIALRAPWLTPQIHMGFE